MRFSRRRQGSSLFFVLVVLFTLMLAVAGFQYLASSTLRQVGAVLRLEDSQFRADGLLELIVSRWKKYVRYQFGRVVASTMTGARRVSGTAAASRWAGTRNRSRRPTDRSGGRVDPFP